MIFTELSPIIYYEQFLDMELFIFSFHYIEPVSTFLWLYAEQSPTWMAEIKINGINMCFHASLLHFPLKAWLLKLIFMSIY